MRKLIYSRYKLEVAVVKESSNVRELKTIDWEYSSILSLMSISSYVEYETDSNFATLESVHKKVVHRGLRVPETIA